jgi:nucleotide-binding universal stress UspA family protein
MATVVVGTDGSPSAQRAVSWALGEARIRGADVRLVHAWMVPLLDALPEPWAIGVPALDAGNEQRVHDKLEEAAGAFLDGVVNEARRREPTLGIEGELVEARPAHALLEAARGADLLVVGSRGGGGFAGLRLGSVSSQCVHHAPCPVVVVPDPGEALLER